MENEGRPLGEGEELYRLLVESAEDYAIFVLDPEGRVATWNAGAERIKGYRPDEILGRHFSVFYPRGDAERGRLGEVLRLAATEGRYEEEGRRVRKDGSVFWADVGLTALRDEAGRLRGFAKVTRDVTEKKEAEEALRASEERFRTLADNISQLAWMADEEGRIFWYNRRWFDYTGTALEEVRGWGWTKAHHPDHVERVVERVQRSWETGEPWEDTFPLRGRDGKYRWFLSRALPIRDEAGKIVRWFGTNTDVTELREAEEALRRSEERFRATFEQAAVGVAHVAPDGSWLRVNDGVCRIVGYPREELLDMTFQDVTHPDDLRKDLEHVRKLLAGETGTYSMEKRYLRKGGSVVWVNLTVSLVREESGEPDYFISVVEDVSERKRAEEELRRQAELLDLSYEPIFAWGLGGGGIVYWNRGAQELYGFSRGEALGSESHRLLGTVHPVPLERFEAELERDGRWAGELEHAARDGRRVVVESRHELVETSDGRRLVLETNRDVTERKEAEEELQRSGERIANILESVTDAFFTLDKEWRFTYVNHQAERVLRRTREELLGKNQYEEFPEAVGSRFEQKYREAAETRRPVHFEEFYAPLGVWVEQNVYPSEEGLSVYFRDVTERKRAEEALREAREAERRRISRDLHDVVLQDLSGALQGLQLDRLRAERSGLDVDLGEEIAALRRVAEGLRGAVYDLRREGEQPFVRAVEDLVESERRANPQREVGLSVGEGFPEGLPEARGVELLRVVREALTNVRRHSGAGRVGVVLGADGGRVRVEVSDDGRGFAPGESPETPRGGVGLSTMRERVEALGGELQIRSSPGGGTRVTALVPFS